MIMEEFSYDELVKATENFSPSRLIGKGSHGGVYKGVLKNKNLVAIKKSSMEESSKMENEIQILSSLRRNPHVINLMGRDFGGKLLVMEIMPNGSLHDMLHVASIPPSWSKRLDIALQIARAVLSLHEGKPLVIHRDIKSANILFDSNWNAKLADFGLAVRKNDGEVNRVNSLSRPAGTMGYLDPCYTTPGKLSTKIDVFSLGILMFEIISCRKVIDVHRTPSSIDEWALPLIKSRQIVEICDTRISLPKHMRKRVRNMLSIAGRCVSAKEEFRPSIGEIVMEMENKCVSKKIRISIPTWTSILGSVIVSKRQRKLDRRWWNTAKVKCATQEDDEESGDSYVDNVPKGLLLKDFLADFDV